MLLFLSAASFWVSVSVSALLLLLSFALFFRVQKIDKNASKNSNSAVVPSGGSKSPSLSGPDEEPQKKVDAFQSDGGYMSEEKESESPKFFFKFQYQTKTFEEFRREVYQGKTPEDDLSSTAEEPQDLSSGDRELYREAVSPRHEEINEDRYGEFGFVSEEDLLDPNAKEEVVPDQTSRPTSDVRPGKQGHMNEETSKKLSSGRAMLEDFRFLSMKDFNALDSDLDSLTSSYDHRSRFMSSTTDGFLSDRDFEAAFDLASSEDMEGDRERLSKDYLYLHDNESEDEDVDEDLQEEYRKLVESQDNGPEDCLDIHDNESEDEDEDEDEDLQEEYRKLVESQETVNQVEQEAKGGGIGSESAPTDSNKSGVDNPSASDSEDSNGLETLWEHQELIEQLKLELKKVRATGLPTILEESEYPKIMEDLKPWKIDENFHHEDRMGELHKFYRSYRERMRKFDVLCYQKMYPIGFLPSKDALQLYLSHKPSSTPAITSLIKRNFRLGKQKKPEELDEMMKYMKELHGELEAVYVGQLCLSWEVLRWQYEKALEIWECDPHGIRQYTEVAGEFQQFQVLLQRFIENEPFEGPRIQNYTSHRRTGLNFLQVPAIREDRSSQDKRKAFAMRKRRDHDAITSDVLVEILEESIRLFWKFVQADKDANAMTEKSRRARSIEPLDAEDIELLAEVQMSLQKKEKKLKEGLRGGNFILRKFQKHQEENADQVSCFFVQVDLKLVGRVLSMSKITRDQLLWCRSKLSRISFVNRKVQVEPSFLLFPC